MGITVGTIPEVIYNTRSLLQLSIQSFKQKQRYHFITERKTSGLIFFLASLYSLTYLLCYFYMIFNQ